MMPVLGKIKTCHPLPVEEEAVEINQHQGTKIIQLPFDCFHLIFSRIDIRTQILALRTVCHAWHDHITQICASKSHLTLKPHYKLIANSNNERDIPNDWFFLGDPKKYLNNRETYCNDLEFLLPRLTKLTTISLINHSSLFSLFAPNLTELTLNFGPVEYEHQSMHVENVAKLLKSFTAFTNLHTLKLYICSGLIRDFFQNDHKTIQLLYWTIGDCITHPKFPRLTNFDLSMDCYLVAQRPEFIRWNHEIDFDPHLLSQLEHFSLDFYTKRVPELMGQLNPGLTCLTFNCHQLPPQYNGNTKVERLDPALLGEPKFEPSLTHLRLEGAWPVPLKLFCDLFSALQTVQLGAVNTPFDQNWIKSLNQLEHLVELRLIGFRIHVSTQKLALDSRCLPRVKKLTWYDGSLLIDFARIFCSYKCFDGDLFCRTVAGQFPILEELVLVTGKSNKHAQQVRDHLYHFNNLQTIFLHFDF